MASTYTAEDQYTVLVTGANAGLGFAICRRLIDEFLSTRPHSTSLNLIITTRTKRKATDTLTRLRHALHTSTSLSHAEARNPGAHEQFLKRITLDYELLDLLSLTSVHAAAARLNKRYTKLDAVILNAGIGGWTAVDWPKAVWSILTQRTAALTWPSYKISTAGGLAERQMPPGHGSGSSAGHRQEGEGAGAKAAEEEEPVLGEVFTANVFGHYVLTHLLMPLLAGRDPIAPFSSTSPSASPSQSQSQPQPQSQPQNNPTPARIIWISTLEAYSHAFTLSDFQSLNTPLAYEGSKRLTDLLALTSRLPSTEKWTAEYCSVPNTTTANTAKTSNTVNNNTSPKFNTEQQKSPLPPTHRPKHYLTHPGICATGIMPLPLLLQYCMLLAFYICRLVGSIWHTCDAYTGATAAVWLALASEETLEAFERPERIAAAPRDKDKDKNSQASPYATTHRLGKWGSAADVFGNERVERTEVEGWGFGGVPGDGSAKGWRRGRRKGARDSTREEREAFEVLGRECWRGVEELRVLWEGLLGFEETGRERERS